MDNNTVPTIILLSRDHYEYLLRSVDIKPRFLIEGRTIHSVVNDALTTYRSQRGMFAVCPFNCGQDPLEVRNRGMEKEAGK